MKIETLKEQAREHEQREEWGKAMRLYSEALERASEQDDPEIVLHNRIGDLRVRLGDLEGAIESYEAAIDLYLEAELANNAMAVCRKLERNAPHRPSVRLRMGQIRVRQGFVVDARRDFLAYAELQLSRGDADEALRALEEFAALAPGDAEIRVFLAEHLHGADRGDDAVKYLRQAYRIYMDEGNQDGADTVRARVAELAPDEDLDGLPSEGEASEADRVGDGLAGFEATSFSGLELDGPVVDQEPEETAPEPPEGLEESTIADDTFGTEDLGDAASGEEALLDESTPEGTEEQPAAAGEDDTDATPEVLEGAVFDLDDDSASDAAEEDEAPLSDGSIASDSLDELTGDFLSEDAPDPDEDAHGTDIQDLPTLDDPTEPGVADASDVPGDTPGPDLPYLDDPAPASEDRHPESGDPAALEREPLEAPPEGDLEAPLGEDLEAWRRRGVELFEEDREEEARELLERAHRAYGEAGDPERAMRVVRELIFHEPDRIGHYQRLVEYAHRTHDRTLLVPAFLELAEALERMGASRKAEAVYGQVLALDPRNPRARAGLAAGVPGGASGEKGGGDFVDLGGMILDGPREDAFRWKVSDADPSGDEEADFAKMLLQFKEKVAHNLPSDDATAHYDLGAAYKEMGLLDEAVGQFQDAIRAHPSHLAAYEMVGQCFLEKGEPDVAARTLQRALDVPHQVEDELLGIYYYLGKAHEQAGNPDAAREFYERVFSLDINFQDVTERLRELR